MPQKYKLLLLTLTLPLLYACNSGDTQRQAESEEAYQEYSDFVTAFEQDSLTETELRAMEMAEEDTTGWETEKANLQQQFEERRQRVTQNQELYNPQQQEEIRRMEDRYNKAFAKREQQYGEVSRRYELRKEMLGLHVNADDMSSITSANISGTYHRFVSILADRAENFKDRDWELVEGWWSALNNRYRALENELQQAERRKIEQAQDSYLRLREKYQISS